METTIKKQRGRPRKVLLSPILNLYKVTIAMNNDTHSFETNDLVQTLLDLKPESFKTKLVITVEKGDRKVEKQVMYSRQVRKLFNNKLTAQFFMRNIEKQLV